MGHTKKIFYKKSFCRIKYQNLMPTGWKWTWVWVPPIQRIRRSDSGHVELYTPYAAWLFGPRAKLKTYFTLGRKKKKWKHQKLYFFHYISLRFICFPIITFKILNLKYTKKTVLVLYPSFNNEILNYITFKNSDYI